MPTGEETWDNIVAYWCPNDFNRAGQTRTFSYKLSWCADIEFPDALGRSIGTWIGFGEYFAFFGEHLATGAAT